MFLYPGGHVNRDDLTPLIAAQREVREETGLSDLDVLKIFDNELIPIDIDTHIINYNDRLNLPEHYHFDFRYLFVIDKISEINVDVDEISMYRWMDLEELMKDSNYRNIITKIFEIL